MADFALVTGLVDVLKDADIRAHLELSELRVPGVWVRIRGIEHDSMQYGDDVLTVEAIAIVKDRDPGRVYSELFGLFNQIKDAVGIPDDSARIVSVNHPEGGTLPGLAIPYQLL